MPESNSWFDIAADAIIKTLTYIINSYSGLLQLLVYVLMFLTFSFALFKVYQALRVLAHQDLKKITVKSINNNYYTSINTPLSIIAASFFFKSKGHYLEEQKSDGHAGKIIPPDAFIRDAAFQFSERYFEEKFLEPISMLSNLMPPMGFIGTIMGMVIHFLSNSGTLNSEITIAGIATALYTTFIALICYTVLEFCKKIFFSLAHKRIDEGLSAASNHHAPKSPSTKVENET
ncbi:MAG: hypothetical protein B6I22_02525 [Desulfobacteraceae bacterium 4572_123]|nr:MAG: hypothetical protein B6I22_02525 [Desulfobacteraceae bacterium 4572_123]